MFITLTENILAPVVSYYYCARKATCLICLKTEEILSEDLIWSWEDRLIDTPSKHCSRCGSRMYLDTELVPVLDLTKGGAY